MVFENIGQVAEEIQCEINVIVSATKWGTFLNLIAVLEKFYKIHRRNLAEFSMLYEKLPCMQTCHM